MQNTISQQNNMLPYLSLTVLSQRWRRTIYDIHSGSYIFNILKDNFSKFFRFLLLST